MRRFGLIVFLVLTCAGCAVWIGSYGRRWEWTRTSGQDVWHVEIDRGRAEITNFHTDAEDDFFRSYHVPMAAVVGPAALGSALLGMAVWRQGVRKRRRGFEPILADGAAGTGGVTMGAEPTVK